MRVLLKMAVYHKDRRAGVGGVVERAGKKARFSAPLFGSFPELRKAAPCGVLEALRLAARYSFIERGDSVAVQTPSVEVGLFVDGCLGPVTSNKALFTHAQKKYGVCMWREAFPEGGNSLLQLAEEGWWVAIKWPDSVHGLEHDL